MKAMMILASVMSKAGPAGQNLPPENNRAATLICAELTRRYPSFIGDYLNERFAENTINLDEDNRMLGEYVRLCPGDIYDPFLDYLIKYHGTTECNDWRTCKKACNDRPEYAPCAEWANTAVDVSFLTAAKLENLKKLWKQFKEQDVEAQNRKDWKMDLDNFMSKGLEEKHMVYAPVSNSNIEQDMCCDDKNFKMEQTGCLDDVSTVDANKNYYYTGQYRKDFFDKAYDWSGAPEV
eukprot:501701_1